MSWTLIIKYQYMYVCNMAKRYCPYCCQNVVTVPRFKLWAVVLGLLFGIIPGFIYWWYTKGEMCPICHCNEEEMEPPKKLEN